PVLSPAGGRFTGAQQVTIATTTPRAAIRYTTDGSEPTAASTLYASALSLSATTTVKARAFRSDLADSGTATGTFIQGGDADFDPLDLSTGAAGHRVSFWFRADAGIDTDGGGQVQTWRDQSGRGIDASRFAG